jgi:putative FmdB family regulatory protein
MVTYEYKCTSCPETTTVQAKMGTAEAPACPSCGGSTRRVFGAGAVTFKGSGFYRTDSRRDR